MAVATRAAPGSPSLQTPQGVPATFLGAGPAHRGAVGGKDARHTHQHGPVAPAAAQVHQVDLPDPLLVHKAGPKVHPAGGELQLGHGHGGLQGHHLWGQSRSRWGPGDFATPGGL